MSNKKNLEMGVGAQTHVNGTAMFSWMGLEVLGSIVDSFGLAMSSSPMGCFSHYEIRH